MVPRGHLGTRPRTATTVRRPGARSHDVGRRGARHRCPRAGLSAACAGAPKLLLHGDPLPPPIILPLLLCRSGGSVARPPPSPPPLASTCSWRPHDASMPRCLRLRPQPHASDFFLISPAFVRTTRAPSPFCPLALALGLASYAVHTTNCRMPGRDLIGTVSETTRGLWCEVGAEGGQRGGSC